MRIGVDARSAIGQHPRGEGKTLLQLYAEIARQRPQWEFCFFGQADAAACRGRAGDALRAAVPQARLCGFHLPGFRWNTWEHIGLPVMAALQRVDVLHCFSSGGPAWGLAPMVMTVHDLIPLLMDDGQTPAARERFKRRLSAGLTGARRIVTVSEHTRRDLLRLFPETPPQRCSVVHWGAPALRPDSIARRLEHWPQLRTQGHLLAFGGGGAKRKNTLGVVRMFGQLAQRYPWLRLRMVGATHAGERAAIAEALAALGLQERADILSFVNEAELAQAFDEALCLVYLSTYEGFGLPPLEAMARGVPVIASAAASIPEVVGDAGLLVDPHDPAAAAGAVAQLVDDPAAGPGWIRRGADRVESFRWSAAAKTMIDTFETLTTKPRT